MAWHKRHSGAAAARNRRSGSPGALDSRVARAQSSRIPRRAFSRHTRWRFVMSSLIDSIAQAFPSDAIGQIAKVADLKPDFVGKGLNVIGPLVTGALAAKAATPGGLSSLMNMLPSGKGDTGLGVGDLLGYLKPGAAKETLNGIFGSGTSAV